MESFPIRAYPYAPSKPMFFPQFMENLPVCFEIFSETDRSSDRNETSESRIRRTEKKQIEAANISNKVTRLTKPAGLRIGIYCPGCVVLSFIGAFMGGGPLPS